MAKSRYAGTPLIDNRRYGTWRLPVRAFGYRELDLLDGVKTVEHVFQRGERLDKIAARYYNEESYWWLICAVNGIRYPFASGGLTPGRTLKVPVDPKDVFDKIFG